MLSLSIKSRQYTFPPVWLRENCRCEHCFFHEGHQRLLDPDNQAIDDASIQSYQLSDTMLFVNWLDGHSSSYSLSWLEENGRFLQTHKPDDFELRMPWSVADLPNIPAFKYHDIVEGGLRDHLGTIAKYGVFLVSDAPVAENTVTAFAEEISFSGIRSTNFGSIFDLRVHDHKNMKLAFTNQRISLHNDLLIRRQPPTVTLLHCLQKSGAGGESLVADGLAVSLYMKERYRSAFDLLAETEIDVEDINNDWHYVSRRPVISIESGRIKSIHFNNWERPPNIRIEASRYNDFRLAYQTFSRLAHSEHFCQRHALAPGEILVVDNSRLLHGREAFADGAEFTRHLQGCHIDVDDLISAFRKTKVA